MKLNEKIKNAIKAAGLTQQQVADATGIDRQVYSMYERGARNPRLDKLGKIAEACGVTLDYFGNTESLQKRIVDKKEYRRLYMQSYMKNYRKRKEQC